MKLSLTMQQSHRLTDKRVLLCVCAGRVRYEADSGLPTEQRPQLRGSCGPYLYWNGSATSPHSHNDEENLPRMWRDNLMQDANGSRRDAGQGENVPGLHINSWEIPELDYSLDDTFSPEKEGYHYEDCCSVLRSSTTLQGPSYMC